MPTILQFKNVTFSYSPDSKKILNNVSLELEQGKSYALIGPTGEGKSTTASLMSKLLTPNSGQIVFQNKDLLDWNKVDLYNQIGFILQEPYLFSGTLLDNIVYGNDELMHFSTAFNPNVSKEEGKQFEKILIDKGLDKLIALFPDRLKTEVTNNSANISLGQKQIINFVRVILRSPSFLILDEASANLDTITEKLLQEILDKLPKETTKVIIAHRLNTIKNVDQVFQVGGGRVEIMKF
jgi:ATP-binding cassette, subfamily B, bacterial